MSNFFKLSLKGHQLISNFYDYFELPWEINVKIILVNKEEISVTLQEEEKSSKTQKYQGKGFRKSVLFILFISTHTKYLMWISVYNRLLLELQLTGVISTALDAHGSIVITIDFT